MAAARGTIRLTRQYQHPQGARQETMEDRFGHHISYLRVSVTDRCNERCQYCMPDELQEWLPRGGILSYEEIERVVGVGASLGIRKVRVTGGEPLTRRDVLPFLRRLCAMDGIDDVGISTNGTLLAAAPGDGGADTVARHLRDFDLIDAPEGLHVSGDPASSSALSALEGQVEPRHRMVWARFDGIDFANGDARFLPLAELEAATAAAGEDGLLVTGDLVVGERGAELLVLPQDAWEEGADVVAVESDGTRTPLASTLPRLLLCLLGEATVLYDEEGEFQGELFDEHSGELLPEVERRLVRRWLDLDDDGPWARFRLAQLLRREGERRGARRELEGVVKRAPRFAWAQFELGRIRMELDQPRPAHSAFLAAAEAADEPGLQAWFHAWAAASAPDDSSRTEQAQKCKAAFEGFALAQYGGAQEALAEGDVSRARDLVRVGLAVEPRHLGLLELKGNMPEPTE